MRIADARRDEQFVRPMLAHSQGRIILHALANMSVEDGIQGKVKLRINDGTLDVTANAIITGRAHPTHAISSFSLCPLSCCPKHAHLVPGSYHGAANSDAIHLESHRLSVTEPLI